MTKTLMIIGAADEHCLGILQAKAMGYKVFVTDGAPNSPGFKIADDYRIASTYDIQITIEQVDSYILGGGQVDGVMTLASDVPWTVAMVADHLHLPSIGLHAARLVQSKAVMKKALKGHVSLPEYQVVGGNIEACNVAREMGFPIVVKPVDSRGARGVQLIRKYGDVAHAYNVAMKYSTVKKALIEQYLPGPQLSTEGVMLNGVAYIPAIFDRNYEYLETYAPYIIENGGEMPSVYSDRRAEIVQVMQDAGNALGIWNGPIKGDLVIHDDKVKVIEIAGRLSGGFFATVATKVSTGVDLIKTGIKLAMGEKVDPKELEPKWNLGAAIRFAFPPPGILGNVKNWDKVWMDDYCRYAHLFVRPGDAIAPIRAHPNRPAVVVTCADNAQDAKGNAIRLIDMLEWDVKAND
jgi:phosphoribosylamine-glycine ligase